MQFKIHTLSHIKSYRVSKVRSMGKKYLKIPSNCTNIFLNVNLGSLILKYKKWERAKQPAILNQRSTYPSSCTWQCAKAKGPKIKYENHTLKAVLTLWQKCSQTLDYSNANNKKQDHMDAFFKQLICLF